MKRKIKRRRTSAMRGVHAYIESEFVQRGGPSVMRTYRRFWRDASNLQCGRAVATGLREHVEEGKTGKAIRSKTARTIVSFLHAAGYTPTRVEAPTRSTKLRCATRIDLVAVRQHVEYVIEIKVASATGWCVPMTSMPLRHAECPDTPCNRAWVQAAIGAVMYSARRASTCVRARVLHVHPKPHGAGFMARMIAEPPWVRRKLMPWLVARIL
jgi:hypothetical protein